MPLPTRKKGESEGDFVSRCVSFMSRKGEGKSQSQRIAICKSRAAASLTDEEMEVLDSIYGKRKKKKKEDKVY